MERPLPEWGNEDYTPPEDQLRIQREPSCDDKPGEHVIVSCTARQYALWRNVEMLARRAGQGDIDRQTFSDGLDEIFGVTFRQQLIGRRYTHLHVRVEP